MRSEKGNILVFVLAGFLILAIGAAGYFFWQNQQLQTTSNSQPIKNNNINFPTPTNNNQMEIWKTHTTSKYEIKYPTDWKSQITPLEGEKLFQIGPYYPSNNYPALSVNFSPLNTTSLHAWEQSYSNQGLYKSTVKISGNEYLKYSGTLPTKTVDGQIISSPIQSTHLLIEKSSDLFDLGYSYEGSTLDASLEKTFNQILSTFNFIEVQGSRSNLSKNFKSPSGRVSFKYFPDWKLEQSTSPDAENMISLQGPKQKLVVYENGTPNHGFDDFKTEPIKIEIAGKKFVGTKWTSQSWGTSFIEVKIQDAPYSLYVQYGDAASVGFQGYNQKSDEKMHFESDIKPIIEILSTFSWKQ